jgi:beta-glucanase (GH16 family)
MRTSLLLAAASALAPAAFVVTAGRTGPLPGDVLIFEDNFTSFNFSVWKHEITLAGDGNWAFELYQNNRTNSYVRGGQLHLRPTLSNATFNVNNADVNLWAGDFATTCTDNGFFGCERTGGGGGNIVNPITSARIRTAESFAFKYGRVEVVAKLPKGDWLWPAIWMMPSANVYGAWPASGEIDIVESRGNARGYPGGGVESFSSTLHWGPFWSSDGYLATHAAYTLPSGELSDGFHTYGFIWNETSMIT